VAWVNTSMDDAVDALFGNLPRSKQDAKAKGSKFFFPGLACKAGHIAERYVNGGCVPCAKRRAREGDASQKLRKKTATQERLKSIVKKCKRLKCGREFTPLKRMDQVFCSQRCADLQGRYDWKARNAESYKTGEAERKKRKYHADPEYANKTREKTGRRYIALDPSEKLERSRRARERIGTDALRHYFREYHRERYSRDINFRIAGALRARLRAAVASRRGGKALKTIELIGCTIEELRIHLEKSFKEGMSWDNYGEWHIDHVRPCASFPNLGTDKAEQQQCFHYTNLQALWAIENMRKRDKV
jgi:hypothetical protein